MNVIEYCTEEVRRQGHDVTFVDGIIRVSWMLRAWVAAIESNLLGYKPELSDVLNIGKIVESVKNKNGFRRCYVRVGFNSCPPPNEIADRLERLFQNRDDMPPLEFYREFELIHPFADGNGRTGKILLNWLNGTLLDPIFPPTNFWGERTVNP